MPVYTTEITSDALSSDNPLHQRLLKAYYLALPYAKGRLLELGCGEGRGVSILKDQVEEYMALDKIPEVILRLKNEFPGLQFQQAVFPPVPLPDEQFDVIVSFQVIEHVKKDADFLAEIYRLLKPGGRALISTPNIRMSLSRNPWHIREYTADGLEALCNQYFDKVEMMGVAGSEKVMTYHEDNRKAVRRMMRWDVFNLQYRLPAWVLRWPYEILNRKNRKGLEKGNTELVQSISLDDYFIREKDERNLDLFCILHKSLK
jgi:SAM-dependent methyltransferase